MLNLTRYLIVSLLFTAFAAKSQQVVFSGNADKKYDGSKIVLYNRSTEDHDSAIVKDGKFTIKVKYKEPTVYMFYSELEMKIKGGYSPFGVMVTGPGTVKIDANIESFTESKISGAKENDIYKQFSAESGKAQQKIFDDLYSKYGKDFVNKRDHDTADVRYKQLMQDYEQMSEANNKSEMERLEKFINANPGSYSAVSLLNSYASGMEPQQVEKLFAMLGSKYKDSRSAKSITKGIEAKKITAIGQVAPDFAQPDTLGRQVKLTDFRGKYVLLDFWASWCGPCRMENPNVVKAFNAFKDKGFTVLGVSLDQPGKKDAWLAAIHKDKLTWSHVSDLKFWDNEAAALYGIKGIPANLLIDKDGKIVAKDLKGEELTKKLSELLGG